MILGVSWLGVVDNTDRKRRLINSCAGDTRLLMVVFRYTSKLRYGSDLVSLALISSLLITCTYFSARPFAWGWYGHTDI